MTKQLTFGLIKTGGRNFQGRITVRHRGGGHKRIYRILTSHQIVPARVIRIDYDPNRSAYIALIRSLTSNYYYYILAPDGLTAGSILSSTSLGTSLPLSQFPLGSKLYDINNKVCRAAGTFATLIALGNGKATLILPSKKTISLSANFNARLGRVSNPQHNLEIRKKAGASRWLGIRPTVRGEAMNPVDHPHGGKTKGGRLPRSPWGKLTRGKKTK
jgi:large subunit ribosomal protein L2